MPWRFQLFLVIEGGAQHREFVMQCPRFGLVFENSIELGFLITCDHTVDVGVDQLDDSLVNSHQCLPLLSSCSLRSWRAV